ncbi:MAG: hypothetical protein ACRDO1_01050 [Nocardioidaceae bacterium]
MRLLRHLVLALSVAVPLSLTPAAWAESRGPWSDVASSDFSVPAGARCPFALSSTVLSDDEQIRTLSTFEDGTPRTQKVVGQLIVRLTNEDTGASVERNLTGNGIFTWRADGTLQELALQGGHFAAGLQPTDPEGPAFLVFTGAGHAVSFAPDGTRTVTRGSGPVENICTTLAG